MKRGLINIITMGNLIALSYIKVSANATNQKDFSILQSSVEIIYDTITEAIVNYNSNCDFQGVASTPTLLWTIFDEPIRGVYGTMMFQDPPGITGRYRVWNFFDINNNQWVRPPDTPYLPVNRSRYGNMAVIYGNATYLYHPVFTAHMDPTNYTGDVWWPDTPFDPRNFSGEYVHVSGPEINEVWPHVGSTTSGYLHKIFTDYDGHMSGIPYAIMYNRIRDLNNPSWDGYIPLETEGGGPFYGFYADPFSRVLAVIYRRAITTYDMIMLIDTMEGDMYYGGMPIMINITQILMQNGYPYLSSGLTENLFIDKSKNIHLIIFTQYYSSNFYPVYVLHFSYNPQTNLYSIHHIKTLSNYYYECDVRAGRSQIGQERINGTLYAIWEEAIQEPGRFVISSTNDTLAPTRIILARSVDNGATWTEEILLESDNVPGSDNNDWLTFPVISPIIPNTGNLDLVYWGVYFDDDPGFASQGQGGPSTIKMLMGIREVGIKEFDRNLKYEKAKIFWNGKNIIYEIPYKSSTTLRIFDITGREVYKLFNENLRGKYELKLDRIGISSGIYFLNLETQKEKVTGKFILK